MNTICNALASKFFNTDKDIREEISRLLCVSIEIRRGFRKPYFSPLELKFTANCGFYSEGSVFPMNVIHGGA